jgi:hypothetical protein
MFSSVRLKPRTQGDLGEWSAMEWLHSIGGVPFVPIRHSPHIDLVAYMPEGRLLGVQVKTSTVFVDRRWQAMICTRGGNRSWSGIVTHFDPMKCDYLFVLVGDGRRWFIPTAAIESRTHISLGGPKYAEFEVEPGRPLISSPETIARLAP